MYLVLLLFIPLVIGLAAYVLSRGKITMIEFLLQEAVMVLVIAAGVAIAFNQATADTEFVNGRVTSKLRERVSCEHSYSCNCSQSCDEKGSCTTVCQTCYDHDYDVSWYVYTNVGYDSVVEINRIDRQGLNMPPRWSKAFVNEPVTFQHGYTNYIKASPDTVLRRMAVSADLMKRAPNYPTPYDYYRADKLMIDGTPLKRATDWAWLLTEMNADLGNSKLVNISIIVTAAPSEFEYAVEEKWIGGKKNDVIVIIGSLDGQKIQWVRLLSWSLAEDLKVYTRDAIMQIGDLNQRDAIMNVIKSNVVSKYKQRSMEDFKYLAMVYQPSGGVTAFLFIFGILTSAGMTWFTWTNEITDNG